VDAVVARPPKELSNTDSFSAVASIATRVLKPGGSLIVMTSPACWHELIPGPSACLIHQWTFALIPCPARSGKGRYPQLNRDWTAVVWFVKAHPEEGCSEPVSTSESANSDDARALLAQSPNPFEQLLLNCTRPGDTVLDLFLGDRAVAEAARNTGRNYIAVDSGEEAVARVKSMIAAQEIATRTENVASAENARSGDNEDTQADSASGEAATSAGTKRSGQKAKSRAKRAGLEQSSLFAPDAQSERAVPPETDG
jgi:hypothetical protein